MDPEQAFCAECGEPIVNLRGYWTHSATLNPYCGGLPNATARIDLRAVALSWLIYR